MNYFSFAIGIPVLVLTFTATTSQAQYLPPAPKIQTWSSGKLSALHDDEAALIRQGFTHAADNRPADAASSFEQALKLRPSNSDTLFLLALAQESSNKPDQAVQTLDESLWFSKHSLIPAAEVLTEKARLLVSRGEFAKAQPIAAQALAAVPQSVRARCVASAAAAGLGNRGDSIRILRETPAPMNTSEEIRFALARALLLGSNRSLNQSEIEEARGILSTLNSTETSSLEPKQVAQEYIRSLIAVGKVDSASVELQRAMKLYPADSDLAALERQLDIEKSAHSEPTPASS